MGWFSDEKEIKAVGTASQSVTSGLRQLFTGEVPPEIVKEMNKIDEEGKNLRWKIDATIPWWRSSRSVVLLWLNFHSVAMVYIVLSTDVTFNSPAVVAILSLTGVVNTAFFGSKGIEYIKAGKAP